MFSAYTPKRKSEICGDSLPSRKSHPRIPFTIFEDELLKKLVQKYGTSNWNCISKQMNGRNSRQCRDRWINYLSPDVVNGPWTNEEEELLVCKYEEYGPCWKHIATFFPTRTDINIKSRWNLRERRIKKEKIRFTKEQLRKNAENFTSSILTQNIINQTLVNNDNKQIGMIQQQKNGTNTSQKSSLDEEDAIYEEQISNEFFDCFNFGLINENDNIEKNYVDTWF